MRSLLLAAAALLAPGAVDADADAGRPFAPVFEGLVAGDLLLIGNSNLLSAGGWSVATDADVDGDDTVMCAERPVGAALCADNSSSADLDLPAGARVITARLYVETSLGRRVGPVAAELDGPRFSPRRLGELPSTPTSPRKLYEAVSGVLRSAVWDVTDYVAAAGRGTYTVADIVSQRAGSYLPYASWAMVVAYELDPAVGLDGVAPADRHRFDARVLSWHDGFQPSTASRSTSPSPTSTSARGPFRSARASTSSRADSPASATTCCSPASRWATATHPVTPLLLTVSPSGVIRRATP